MKTHGTAVWQGGIKDGKGAISTKSGALKDYPYGFSSRFEGKPGTNPEELIGAAHAGCFTMALSLILGEAKLTAEHMETTAEVTLDKVAAGFAITCPCRGVWFSADRKREQLRQTPQCRIRRSPLGSGPRGLAISYFTAGWIRHAP
jgi:organic hydroperoxide reductase OsmC/OhrA